MDLPLHVVTGAVIGNALLYHTVTRKNQDVDANARLKLALAAFLTGVVSHLLWDWLPHYDWLFYVKVFEPLPLHWLIPQALTTLPVILANLHLNRDARPLAAIAMFGGIYPDVEKLLYFDFHLPRQLVIFRQHSCYLTGWRPWERAHKDFLVTFEIVVFLALLIMMVELARARRKRRVVPPSSHRVSDGWRRLQTQRAAEVSIVAQACLADSEDQPLSRRVGATYVLSGQDRKGASA